MSFSNDYQVQACYANHEGSTGRNPQKMRLWITLGKSLPVAYSRKEEYADRTKGIENNCLIARGNPDQGRQSSQTDHKDRTFQRSPDSLLEISAFFSKTHFSYDSHTGPVLLSILSLSPHDKCGDSFKIKGKSGVLSADAERSML